MCHDVQAVVVGATGFIGAPTFRRLRGQGVHVRGLARNPAGQAQIDSVDIAAGDAELERAVWGAGVVIHAASYVGTAVAESTRVNIGGTANLLSACQRAGGALVIYVSTAAVYGYGPHRRACAADTPLSPASPVSQHRREAEDLVLEYGGCVIRPNMLYGTGDRWLVPNVARFLTAAESLPDSVESTMLSVLAVDNLAELLAGLAVNLSATMSARVWNGAPPEPMSTYEFCSLVARAKGLVIPAKRTPASRFSELASRMGFTAHQYDLIFNDHWYDPGDVWSVARVSPPLPFSAGNSSV